MQPIDVASALIINDVGEVLVDYRTDKQLRPLMWEYPGGKREGNETLLVTAQREVREEMATEVVPLRRVVTKLVPFEVPVKIHIVHCLISSNRQAALPRTNSHGGAVRWMSLEHLIRYEPCVPSLYVTYPAVKLYIDRFVRALRENVPLHGKIELP